MRTQRREKVSISAQTRCPAYVALYACISRIEDRLIMTNFSERMRGARGIAHAGSSSSTSRFPDGSRRLASTTFGGPTREEPEVSYIPPLRRGEVLGRKADPQSSWRSCYSHITLPTPPTSPFRSAEYAGGSLMPLEI